MSEPNEISIGYRLASLPSWLVLDWSVLPLPFYSRGTPVPKPGLRVRQSGWMSAKSSREK